MKNFIKLLDESIKLELNVYKIYIHFKNIFPIDEKFWWKIAMEEQEHAAILKSCRDYFAPLGLLPETLISESITLLLKSNRFCTETLEKIENKQPSREDAFNIALSIETNAGEINYQNFMHKETDNELYKMFQKLNGDEIGHYTRIKEYMMTNNIKIIKDE